jgi:hypothetical protein
MSPHHAGHSSQLLDIRWLRAMTKTKAKKVLGALVLKDYDQLRELKVRVYGNSGRRFSQTACITSLDGCKDQCNPRLAFNACTVEDIGCPKCLTALVDLATSEDQQSTPRRWYAVSYSNGVAVSANSGDRYGANYHRFDSRAERDEWAEGGGNFRTSPDWREAVPAADRELRAAMTE